MLTYRSIVILFSADTTWEINLIRNRQWFNELDLGKVLCVWGSFKRFSLRWEVKKRKKVLRPGVMMSKSNWEGVGNNWSYRLSSIIECTADVNKTADLNVLQERETTKSCRKVLKVWVGNMAGCCSRYMSKGPPKSPLITHSVVELL